MMLSLRWKRRGVRRCFLLGYCLVVCFVNSTAQLAPPFDFKFKTYTTLDGLADNAIMKLATDKRGFLWIATHNGISRFDGLHFKNYTNTPADSTSLRSIWATDLIADANKTIWASTEGGVCYYDEKFDRFRYINKPQEIQLIYKGPMCTGPGQVLWVAAENGLKKIDIGRKTFQNTSLNRIPDPQSVIYDGLGNILIGTRGFGLFLYNIESNTTKNLQLPGLASDEHVMSFYKDEEGIWAATSLGLLLIKNDRQTALYTAGAGLLAGRQFAQLMCINSFAPLTGTTKLVCGTYDKNFLLFDKVEKKFTYRWESGTSNPDNLPGGVFYCLYAAGKILWAGSDYGLCKLNLDEQDFVTTLLPEISKGKTLPLIGKLIPSPQDKNVYWMIAGYPLGGLLLYNAAEKKLVKEFSTSRAVASQKRYRQYNNLIAGRSGSMFALADSSLDVFSAAGQYQQSFSLARQAFSLCIGDKQQLWIGTGSGLICVDPITGEQKVYDCTFKGTEVENSSFPQSFRTHALACDADGLVWLASIKYGLFSFSEKTGIFTPYRQPFTGPYETLNRCSGLIPYKKNIWVSTMSGLSCYDTERRRFTNYNSSHGLQSTYVYHLDKDSNDIFWGRGNAGVFSFDPVKKVFVNYNLPLSFLGSLIYQHISPVANGVAVGFEGGYSIFSLKKQQENILPMPIITGCKLPGADFYFNKDSIAISPVSFKYAENSLQFQFEAIQFNHPKDVELFYMLEGIDKTWISARGNNMVAYTNLPEGSYNFKVKAAGTNGLRNDVPAMFRFSISPPFWRTLWFRLLAVFTLAGGIIFLFRYRVASIKKTEQEKTAINKTVAGLEMKMLRSRMNPHFIFNSLNSIQKFIWENKKDDASDYLSKFAKLIRLILDHSGQPSISLAEELDALKLYIELEHRRCNGKFEYAITVGEHIEANSIKVPPLILQPFVENAIWHGLSPLQNRNGVLSVSVACHNGKLVCTITDNGIGRKKAEALKAQSSIRKTSVGIDITRQRLEQINRENPGNISVTIDDLYEDDEASGTKIIIYIPVIKE
ncbi:MAG: histidine kinase [Bacteroidota bacterium]